MAFPCTSTEGFEIVNGFPFPKVAWFTPKNLKETLEYVPHDGDIILACYPKTGSTWLQYIVVQILSKGESFPSIEDAITKDAPIMEMVGADFLDSLKEPRVYKHHVAYNVMQKNNKAKFLYIYRNPEDTFVSYYYFMKDFEELPPMTVEEYFERFLTGDIYFGSYFKNVLSYFEHKEDKNLLLISYECLKLNPKEEILRIAKFLGESYFQDIISNNEEILNKIVEQTTFDYMKKNLVFIHPKDMNKGETSETTSEIKYFRKGIIGDGKQALSSEQLNRLRAVAEEILKGTEVLKEWQDNYF